MERRPQGAEGESDAATDLGAPLDRTRGGLVAALVVVAVPFAVPEITRPSGTPGSPGLGLAIGLGGGGTASRDHRVGTAHGSTHRHHPPAVGLR